MEFLSNKGRNHSRGVLKFPHFKSGGVFESMFCFLFNLKILTCRMILFADYVGALLHKDASSEDLLTKTRKNSFKQQKKEKFKNFWGLSVYTGKLVV